MPFAATWMNLEIIIVSEISQSERERQIPYGITYMQNLKYGTNELIYKTETDPQKQKTNLRLLPKGKGGGRRISQEFGDQQVQTTIYKICCLPKSYCIAQGSIFKIL